jgi:transposase InsO family protein
MVSGLERGSRSANRLNHADMSRDAALGTRQTHTHTHVLNWYCKAHLKAKTKPNTAEPTTSSLTNHTLSPLAVDFGPPLADWTWPDTGDCRGGAWNMGGVAQPERKKDRGG